MTSNYTKGFTIVELLIVIVVIGILAAISIVAYNGIQNRAYDTAIQNDLNNLAKLVHLESADTGTYPAGGGARLTSGVANTGNGTNFPGMKFSPSKENYAIENVNLTYCTTADASNSQAFIIRAKSKSGKSYQYKSTSGSVSVYSTNASLALPASQLSCETDWGIRVLGLSEYMLTLGSLGLIDKGSMVLS